MDESFGKYFDRSYYRRIDKRFSIRPIVYCWWFNFIVALAVFNLSMYMFGDILLGIMHTLLAWTLTLTLSIVYWMTWIQRKLRGGKNVKIVASSSILIMFVIALLFIFRVFMLVIQLTRL